MKIRGTPWRIGITLIGTSLAAIVFLSACNTAPTAVNRPATARNVTGRAGTPQELLNRLHHALQTGDASDAAVTLIALAERFPSKLKDAPDADVRGAAEGALTVNDGGKLERQVLEVLFRAGWTASVGIEASILWVRLARMRLDDKDRAGAREAAARVTAPYERIAMYADLRFDSVMARDSRAEDVRKAGQREIDEIQALARQRPRSMLTVVWLESSLRHMQRYSEALEVNEAVLGTQLDATKRHVQVPFDDIGYLSAIMNGKAYALWGLGSFEEAAREMDAARRLLENGRPNVSETLNMAEMYCRLGEHDRAPARGVRVVSLGSIGLVLS